MHTVRVEQQHRSDRPIAFGFDHPHQRIQHHRQPGIRDHQAQYLILTLTPAFRAFAFGDIGCNSSHRIDLLPVIQQWELHRQVTVRSIPQRHGLLKLKRDFLVEHRNVVGANHFGGFFGQ